MVAALARNALPLCEKSSRTVEAVAMVVPPIVIVTVIVIVIVIVMVRAEGLAPEAVDARVCHTTMPWPVEKRRRYR